MILCFHFLHYQNNVLLHRFFPVLMIRLIYYTNRIKLWRLWRRLFSGSGLGPPDPLKGEGEVWEEKRLGELFEISSGKGLTKEQFIDNGKFPVLGANGEIGRTDDYLYDEKLIFTGRVGTLGNIFIVNNEKVWLSDNTLVVRPHLYFYTMYFILKQSKLEKYNVGSTQPLLRQS